MIRPWPGLNPLIRYSSGAMTQQTPSKYRCASAGRLMLHVARIIMRTRASSCTLRAPTLHSNSKPMLCLNVPVSINDGAAPVRPGWFWKQGGHSGRPTSGSCKGGARGRCFCTLGRYIAVVEFKDRVFLHRYLCIQSSLFSSFISHSFTLPQPGLLTLVSAVCLQSISTILIFSLLTFPKQQ